MSSVVYLPLIAAAANAMLRSRSISWGLLTILDASLSWTISTWAPTTVPGCEVVDEFELPAAALGETAAIDDALPVEFVPDEELEFSCSRPTVMKNRRHAAWLLYTAGASAFSFGFNRAQIP